MDYNLLSIVPIVICFILIFVSKNAFISIISGIVSAVLLVIFKEQKFILLDSIIDVFSNTSTVKTVLFVLIVGALIKATELSDGVNGLICYLENKKINIKSKVLVQLFTMLIGMLLFVDATSSMAITSVVGKPLFKEAKLSTEKLALLTNSTASPIAWLIPFGGAGALMTGLIAGIDGINNDAFSYVLEAVFFQFYTITLLILLVVSILCNFEIGSIKKYEYKDSMELEKVNTFGKARNMVIPIVLLLTSIFTILAITGNGNIFKGDGANAVFYGGLITLFITLIFYLINKTSSLTKTLTWYYSGVKSMFIVTLLLAVALVFSDLLAKVGTANYLVGIFDVMPKNLLPLMALLISAVIAFSTGTSGGTVAIVTGLILPMAVICDVNIALVLGAIVSGSVFGDQNSIISDSVILTSSVTGVNSVTHVKTQLPYTLIALLIAALLYTIIGFLI